MITNLFLMPSCLLAYDAKNSTLMHYTDKVWIILILVGSLTVASLYFTLLTFYYENAARGSAYFSFELIYTFTFDVFIMH
jgi:hypothetical protein